MENSKLQSQVFATPSKTVTFAFNTDVTDRRGLRGLYINGTSGTVQIMLRDDTAFTTWTVTSGQMIVADIKQIGNGGTLTSLANFIGLTY